MSALALTVDQSLVDNYLERVDRFFDNVQTLKQTLMESLNNRFAPDAPKKEEFVYQEAAAAQPAVAQPQSAVVTADDIDLDQLLAGLDLKGMNL